LTWSSAGTGRKSFAARVDFPVQFPLQRRGEGAASILSSGSQLTLADRRKGIFDAMSSSVDLYIYDLAQGMASQFSGLVGFQLEGIWHTAVVAFGTEWFFGAGGIETAPPGGTMLGAPLRTVRLGETNVDRQAFLDYLRGLGADKYQGHRYSLLNHNCNTFSNEVAKFLTNNTIPNYILELPEKVKSSPVAALLGPLIEGATPRGQDFQGPAPARQNEAAEEASRYNHFPLCKYVTFAKEIDAERFRDKVRELTKTHIEYLPTSQGANQVVDNLVNLATQTSPLARRAWTTARYLIRNWPRADTFPVLDAVRWAVSRGEPAEANMPGEILAVMKTNLSARDAPQTVRQLCLKVICNLFAQEKARLLLLKEREDLVSRINTVMEDTETHTQTEAETEAEGQTASRTSILEITAVSVPLNYTVALLDAPDHEASVQLVSSLLTSFLGRMSAPEASYRGLVALGALVTGCCSGDNNSNATQLRDLALALDADSVLQKVDAGGVDKVTQCLAEVRTALGL